jgi:SAM-dependent methyltransferase
MSTRSVTGPNGTKPSDDILEGKRTRTRASRSSSAQNGNSDPSQDVLSCDHPREQFRPIFSTRDYITGEHFVVGYCYRCRLHVTTPVPAEDQIGKYYPKSYYGSGKRFTGVIEDMLDKLYSFRAWHIEQRQKPGKVLDIGCGRGLLLNKLRERGWEPQGTELSEDAAAFARDSLGLPVTTQRLEDTQFPDNEFDPVILWHVLEHVHAPKEMLREVSRILKPGGTLLVAVPNFGSWEARWSGKGWFHLDVPRHLTQFTLKTLRTSLGEAGLTLKEVNFFSTEYDFFSFIQSAQNKMGLRHNLLYNLLRTRSAKVVDMGSETGTTAWRDTILALATAPFLGLVSLFYMPLIAAVRRGATIAAYAVKR